MISFEIKAPSTYYEWVEVLNVLKEKSDDSAVLYAIQNGKIEWQVGVAERFIRKFIDTINSRINGGIDRFQREMERANGEEKKILSSLLTLRKELRFLYRIISEIKIPAEPKEQCLQLVTRQASSMQKSLETSAKQDRSGKLNSIVKNNRINVFESKE